MKRTSQKSTSLYDDQKEFIEKLEEEEDFNFSAFVRGSVERLKSAREQDKWDSLDFAAMWGGQLDFNEEVDFGFMPERVNEEIEFGNLDPHQKTMLTKKFILALIDESTEVLNELSWKDHKAFDPEKVERADLLEEMIDIQKFLFCIGQVWDYTPEEWYQKFFEKTDHVKRIHPEYKTSQKRLDQVADNE